MKLSDYLAEHEADRCTRPKWDEDDERGDEDDE